MSADPPYELSDADHEHIRRDLLRRKRILTRNAIGVGVAFVLLALLGEPLWIVIGLALINGAGFVFMARRYRSLVQTALSAGWHGFGSADSN